MEEASILLRTVRRIFLLWFDATKAQRHGIVQSHAANRPCLAVLHESTIETRAVQETASTAKIAFFSE